jgi:O-acetylserine/cysteine efflux transporter
VEVLAGASWLSLGAVLYLGAVATVWAYATWGRLLQRYPTAVIAPFALLAPCAGVVSSAIILVRCSVPCVTPAWP